MPEVRFDLYQSIGAWLGSGTTVVAGLTFVAYLFGYLSLRFHLAALGVEPLLKVVDDRYLYAAAQFFLFLVPSVSSLLLMLQALLVLVFIPRIVVILIYRLLPIRIRTNIKCLHYRTFFLSHYKMVVSEVASSYTPC
jgi:hypothetical protein